MSTVEKMRDHIRRVLQLRVTSNLASNGNNNNNSTHATKRNSLLLESGSMDQQSFNNIKRSGSAEHAVQAAKDMETAFGQYLRRSADVFDLSKNYEVGGIFNTGFF